jgi:hypothetical protein
MRHCNTTTAQSTPGPRTQKTRQEPRVAPPCWALQEPEEPPQAPQPQGPAKVAPAKVRGHGGGKGKPDAY